MGIGKQMREIWNECVQLPMSLKNCKNKLASDCLSGVSCRGWFERVAVEYWIQSFPKCARFFNTIFVSSHMYPENPEGTQVIVGSMNMGYISDTARNRTHNLFRPKRESIPLGHSDGQQIFILLNNMHKVYRYIYTLQYYNIICNIICTLEDNTTY